MLPLGTLLRVLSLKAYKSWSCLEDIFLKSLQVLKLPCKYYFGIMQVLKLQKGARDFHELGLQCY